MNQSQTIDGSMKLTVTMTAAEWDNIIGVLRKAPFEQVAGAIQTIVAQCSAAAENARATKQ